MSLATANVAATALLAAVAAPAMGAARIKARAEVRCHLLYLETGPQLHLLNFDLHILKFDTHRVAATHMS